ncbi:classical arabinogalactan protein 26 [Abeliophyllum distichum]|uniref:Classical arabinogalactan protein 26 n=1 Tax=Abeliophyllum distichum TaxID=126358 RepID=A0ABD1TDI0_9LAMI
MASSTRSFLILVMVFMASSSSLAFKKASQLSVPASTISAAPALLPYPPLSAPPALSPDIAPLFPSPGGSEPSPSESSIPTIPSSPSPPNPDAMAAPGPGVAFPPEGMLPVTSAVALNLQGSVCFILVLSLVAF